jgi:pimeloyl-ACP methyl ester carboxylesterase
MNNQHKVGEAGSPGVEGQAGSPEARVLTPASKIVWRWVKVALLLYGVAGIALYYAQGVLLFHPRPVDRSVVYDFGVQPYTERNLAVDKETSLNIVQFRATDRPGDSLAKGVVLYFHGNSRNVEWYAPRAKDFTGHGYEVWMMDYPGFGKSTGVFSEKNLYAEALLFYKLARSRWKPGQIVLYGMNMGTGIAAELADVRDCRRLILESPSYSVESVAGHYLPVFPWGRMLHFHFPTYMHLPAVMAPITIFQGGRDWTVPYSNASRLKPLLKAGDEFITVEGAGHNNLHDFPLFRQKLDSVLAL